MFVNSVGEQKSSDDRTALTQWRFLKDIQKGEIKPIMKH